MPHCSSTPRRRPLTMPLTSFEERALPLGAWVILDRFVGHNSLFGFRSVQSGLRTVRRNTQLTGGNLGCVMRNS